MTTLKNRSNTALLVIDVQNGVVEGAHERDAVVANVGSLIEKARRERVPVVWVQHNSEELPRESVRWRIVPELAPSDAEPLVAAWGLCQGLRCNPGQRCPYDGGPDGMGRAAA